MQWHLTSPLLLSTEAGDGRQSSVIALRFRVAGLFVGRLLTLFYDVRKGSSESTGIAVILEGDLPWLSTINANTSQRSFWYQSPYPPVAAHTMRSVPMDTSSERSWPAAWPTVPAPRPCRSRLIATRGSHRVRSHKCGRGGMIRRS